MRQLILLLLLVNPFIVGCWDSIELNDIAVVTGMAIDPGKEKKFRLTVEYVNSSQFSPQSPEQGAPVSVMSWEGDSLYGVANMMNVGISRKLIFSHTRVLLINEEVARAGFIRFLDAIDRSAQFRNDFNILITKGHKAEDFIKINDPVEKIPSIKIKTQIESFLDAWGGDPKVRLTDFINALTSNGRTPVANTIVIEGDPKKGTNSEANMSIQREAIVLVDGLALFKNDKVIGFLSLEDARNYLWTQDLKNTTLSISCHKDGETKKHQEFADIFVNSSKSRMRTGYRGDTPLLRVELFVEGRISGIQCLRDLSAVETYRDFEKAVEKEIEEKVSSTIKKVQEKYGTDIFGFGEQLNRQDPRKFKAVEDSWDEEFSRGEVEVSVLVKLRRSGTKSKSFLTDVEGLKE